MSDRPRRRDRGSSRRTRRAEAAAAAQAEVADGREGPRARARRERRRRRVRSVVGAAVVVGVAAVLAPLAVDLVADLGEDDGGDADAADTPATPDAAVGAQAARLLVAFEDAAADDEVTLAVLDVDGAGNGTVLLVPDGLTTDVPGLGLVPLSSAHRFGGAELVALTLDSLLDLALPAATTLDTVATATLVGRIGGLEVDVPATVLDAEGDTRFEPGPQFLDGAAAAELLTIRRPTEPAVQALPRAGAVLSALVERLDDERLDALFGDGAPMVERDAVSALETVLRGLAEVADGGSVDVRTLPVTPFEAGEEVPLYRLDANAARGLLAERFGGDAAVAGDDRLRLEIRNGNGSPGVGATVAEQLLPLGHRVVLTGNAETFDVAETEVVANDPSDEVVAAAQEIRDALGTGRVVIGDGTRSVADVTIVVGRDFTG